MRRGHWRADHDSSISTASSTAVGTANQCPSRPGETDTHEQGNEYGGAGQSTRDFIMPGVRNAVSIWELDQLGKQG